MIFYPDKYLNNVLEITYELLEKNQIKGILLDVDNTLIDYDRNPIEGLKKWMDGLKSRDIQFCILSNTNKRDKVEKLANMLEIPYFYFAKKPLKGGFKKAKKLLNLSEKNIAVVGDQIMTDIIGAKRCQMYAILVKPLKERDIFITKIKRPIEKWILKKYKQREENKR